MKTIRLFWVALLPLSLLLSCDHRLDPSPLGQFRLKSVSYNARTVNGIPRQQRGYQLTYNSKGSVISYTFSYTQGNGLFFQQYRVERDAQDRPVQVVTDLSNSFLGEFMTYTHSPDAPVSQITTWNRGIDPTDPTKRTDQVLRRYGYVYTAQQGVLVPQPVRRGYLESQLTINNAQEDYTFVNGNAVTINGTPYTYDDKPNPYYGLLGFNGFTTFSENPQLARPANTPFDNSDYFADIQVKLFNRNNITNNTKQITYNADGLVTRIEYTNGNVEEFIYERKP
ncbi:hypothetical protein FAES_4234 [Fibrella aestuarina BUZ 2]|uniref:DUF4595 domain-containing protein n=1 Tax=Fibrella aestuarina BUZ 2 TaxID=1166018 RepID=I0KDN1_9BACT|nr:hypothetical protein [Fibrella aestuarina]CCH02234.1 hypothetical protein FAES_4234 [Fibrella aestuarina BUZ 2]